MCSGFGAGEVLLAIDVILLQRLYLNHDLKQPVPDEVAVTSESSIGDSISSDDILHFPRFIHIAVVTGPLAWTIFAILWNGAAMVDAHGLVSSVVANFFICVILVYGMMTVSIFKDSVLSANFAFLMICKLTHNIPY